MTKLDYRKFLASNRAATKVLAYFGGRFVHDGSRRYGVSVEQPPGFYEFELTGRSAIPLRRADAPDLSSLPVVRGHFARGWLFGGGRDSSPVELLPTEEPPVLAPILARKNPGGELMFDRLEFETESEEGARLALEEERGIADLKHVSASLRAAFGYALAARVSERLEVPITPREAQRAIASIAAEGRSGAERLLRELESERELERVRVEAWLRSAGRRPGPTLPSPTPSRTRGASPAERAARALDVAGAEFLDSRSLDGGLIEVTYRFLGQRFISVVDEHTLQVVDAGICLSGSDRLVTLESLPSVIREGMDDGVLNITRR